MVKRLNLARNAFGNERYILLAKIRYRTSAYCERAFRVGFPRSFRIHRRREPDRSILEYTLGDRRCKLLLRTESSRS